jgi:tRNA A-37 threonylcarbamoyl transferase component Bud32
MKHAGLIFSLLLALALPCRAELTEEIKVSINTFPKCQVLLAEGNSERPLGPSNQPIWIKAPVFQDSQGHVVQYASGTLILRAPGHDDFKVLISNEEWSRGSLPLTGRYQLPAQSPVILAQDYAQAYPIPSTIVLLAATGTIAGALYWRRQSIVQQSGLVRLNKQLDTTGDPLIGKKLGRFEVVSRIGQGGMGSVYRVLDDTGDYAAKVIYFDSADSVHVDRFRREFKLLSQLRHPTFPRSFDYNETPGMAYCIMELCKGETLRSRIQAGGLAWSQISPWVLSLLDGLEFAHQQGIVHRDLKPENLMLDRDGIKILDLGLARSADLTAITKTGQAMGTPVYIAPEQIQGTGDMADPRTDLYSFAIMLYELLTGSPPFVEDEIEKLIAHHLNTIPTPLSQVLANCPVQLEQIVANLLSKNPANRYPSAQRVRDLLSQIPNQDWQTPVNAEPIQQDTVVVVRKQPPL